MNQIKIFYIYVKKKNKTQEKQIDFSLLKDIKIEKNVPIFFQSKFDYKESKQWLKDKLNKIIYSKYKTFFRSFYSAPDAAEFSKTRSEILKSFFDFEKYN